MIVLKCKMCGGALDIQDDATVCECEYCGTRQTVPNVDNEKKLNLFARANRLRSINEFDKASGVYESIIADFPEEAEAYWGLILCKYGIEYVDDPSTGKKVPTCHRSSFDSLMEDPDFELVMEYSDVMARRVYREEAKQIEELRKGIIEVSSKEEPYDIFICYKESTEDGQRTLDSVLAQDIYDMLTENGYRVFFSRVSLEDKLGLEYEPYIFAALNSAKIMLAVGTDYDYYNAVWVKNEWSRFLQLIAKGEKKTLIPCYKNIDAYDMPREFAKLQAQDLGKVGAMQDLLRGVKKILPKEDRFRSGAELQKTNQTEILLRRTFMLLEDGEWDKADALCEQVLNQEPENAQAYLGKLMAELQVRKPSELGVCGKRYNTKNNYLNAFRFGDETLRNELEEYVASNIDYLSETLKKEFEFVVKGNGYSVRTIRNKKSTEIEIPRKCQGKLVTAIEERAFVFCESLTSVTIPDSVTVIGNDAFDSCKSLTNVTIPNSVTTIGCSAFYGCKSLTSVTIPDSVTAIRDLVFYGCESLTSVTIPDSVTVIGKEAFSHCKSLTSVTIPDSVTVIGKEAFSHCKSLTNITIPDSVITIGDKAFFGCESLIGVTIPDSVITIGDEAFLGCESLTSVMIPDSVTTIGDHAFLDCKSLISVTIPDSVISIANGAFYGCERLADQNGFVIVRDVLHSYCYFDEHVTIPESVVTIGEGAFNGRKNLTSVTIPDSVITIGDDAFRGCKNLTGVTIPDSVISIGNGAFYGCERLADQNGFVIVRDVLNSYCHFDEHVKIPDSVITIGDDAFRGCESLTSVTIPDSVISIGDHAFYGCKNLTSVTMPDSITTIGRGAFWGCESLTSVMIADSVTTIGASVLSYCENLETILCSGDYEKLKSAFARNNAAYENIFVCLERGRQQSIEEEKKRKAEEEKRLLMEFRQANGLCLYCGGTFKKSFLSTKCTSCGRKKDY